MVTGKIDRGNVLLLVISIVFSLVIMETGLWLLTPFPIHGAMANRVPHPVLGYTLNPDHKEIDADGFRNPSADGRYDIVAIGDSHTQGFNVRSEESWPYQLADMLEATVYNYGVGGYSIYYYPYLAELAKEKSPSLVLIALYPANDLLLDTPVTEYLASIPNLNMKDFEVKTREHFLKRWRYSFGDMLKSMSAIASAVSYWYEKWGLGDEVYYEVGGQLVHKKRFAAHRKSTDLSDPVVQTSFKNSLIIIDHINNDLQQNGIKLGIVIIPSKELVLHDWAQANRIPLRDGYVVTNEQELTDAYLKYFAAKDINYIDATPFVIAAFLDEVKQAKAFYPRQDGHPLVSGYQSYAKAASILARAMDEGLQQK